MILVHTTLESNRESILDKGIDPAFSQGAYRRVWVHHKRLNKWAVRHVCKRHAAKKAETIHMVVAVPDGWIRWHNRGIAFVDRVIPPECITEIVEA